MNARPLFVTVMLSVAACGSSPAPPTAPSAAVLTTESYSGTTVQTSVNGCSGDTHNITTRDGDISVRLVATSDPNAALSLQVCPNGVDSGSNCTITQQRINVAQTLTGARKGASVQNIKPLPFACVFTSTFSPTPVTYTLSVTYMK